MAVFKCKMCGGDLRIEEGKTVCECDYCGSRQTVPLLDSEKKVTLFTRANRLRSLCEFDKAFGVYESIVADFPEEAEAYWGLILCKYGIEYVDDPLTAKKIPTCHRSSFDNVLEDSDFEMVMEYADSISRAEYRAEAKEIERIRSGIVEVSSKEEPYDIFICYKETDENGNRTVDSVIAQDVYNALTEKGYRVFFSRISLEDKIGREYEPYIFAALHSAKIMLVFGTSYGYFNAVWVKNEWSRYLALIAKGEKKTLIPCYKDVDAYDMPQEFKRLQAQDMGKVGAMQDLFRGIEKILPRKKPEPVKETVIVQGAPSFSVQNSAATPLLKRAFMYLEDGNWKSADDYCEKVLDIDPENGEAFLGKLMAELKIRNRGELSNQTEPFDQNGNYLKAVRYGDGKLKKELPDASSSVIYQCAKKAMAGGHKRDLLDAARLLERIPSYQDASSLIAECRRKAETADQSLQPFMDLLYSRRFDRRVGTRGAVCCMPLVAGCEHLSGLKANGDALAIGNIDYDKTITEKWKDLIQIADGYFHTVGLKADGTVVAASSSGNWECDVDDWKEITAVAAGYECTVGLKRDGTVVVAGRYIDPHSYKDLEYDTSSWKNIVAVSAGSACCIGLKADGTVVATGDNDQGACDVSGWKDIVAVASDYGPGYGYTVGLKADGTVVATGSNSRGQCDVSGWKDIVSVSALYSCTVGLKADGTVVATGDNDKGQCNVSGWSDIVSVASGYSTTYGLRTDGTVVVAGKDSQLVSGWRDIIAIASTGGTVYGLKADGTVVAAGDNKKGQCNVSGWKLFDTFKSLEQFFRDIPKRVEAHRQEEERRKAEEKRQAEEAEAAVQMEADKIIAAILAKQTGKQEPSLEQQLAVAEQKVTDLEKICSNYEKTVEQVNQLTAEMAEASNKLDVLDSKRASLGLFAMKERKALNSEISAAEEMMDQIDLKLTSARDQLGGFATKADALNALESARTDTLPLRVKFEEEKKFGLNGYSYARAIQALVSKPRVLQIVSEKKPNLVSVYVGFPTITFGRYPQTSTGGYAGIEWLVLKAEDSKALLISKYALDCQKYNTSHASVKWETCSLRKWLNGPFLNRAFNTEEQKMLLNAPITVSSGNKVADKVYILSTSEAKQYLRDAAQCQATAYAKAQGVNATKFTDYCSWWLRSPGYDSYNAEIVESSGSVFHFDVDFSVTAVRPALWISLES